MKRVIDGQTYNTDTATAVARYEYVDDKDYDTEATIYQTRGAAFFIVHKWAVDDRWKFHFEAVSREEVNRIIEKTDNLEIIDEAAISSPPEAEAEAEPGATLYVRMPASLKRRIDEAAKDDGVSGNVWAMRCMERCLEQRDIGDFPELAKIWLLSTIYRAHDGPVEKAVEALNRIADWADELAERLNVDAADAGLVFEGEMRELNAEFDPFANPK